MLFLSATASSHWSFKGTTFCIKSALLHLSTPVPKLTSTYLVIHGWFMMSAILQTSICIEIVIFYCTLHWRWNNGKAISICSLDHLFNKNAYMTHTWVTGPYWFNTLRPRQDGLHFPDDIFKWKLMKMFKFRLRFHWSLFPRVQLTKFHWFR